MELHLKEVEDLTKEIISLREELSSMKSKVMPSQEWYDLKTACQLKGINYHTVISGLRYQPNFGKPDAIICGRKRWRRQTILDWLHVTDEDIPKGKKLNALIGGGK